MIEHHFDLFRLELLADLAPEYALLGFIRIAVYKIIPSLMFRLCFNWHILEV